MEKMTGVTKGTEEAAANTNPNTEGTELYIKKKMIQDGTVTVELTSIRKRSKDRQVKRYSAYWKQQNNIKTADIAGLILILAGICVSIHMNCVGRSLSAGREAMLAYSFQQAFSV